MSFIPVAIEARTFQDQTWNRKPLSTYYSAQQSFRIMENIV